MLASLVPPFDPSNYNYSLPSRAPHNVGGMLGSYLSASLIYRLGVVAFLLPLPWIWMSVAPLGQKDAFRKASLFRFGFYSLAMLVKYGFVSGHQIFPSKV